MTFTTKKLPKQQQRKIKTSPILNTQLIRDHVHHVQIALYQHDIHHP